MRKTVILLIIFSLLFSLTAYANIKKIDRPHDIPSFLGYVPDRIIVVMKSDVGELKARTAVNGVAHIGDTDFDAISDMFAVTSIRKQFAGSDPSPLSKSAELARYYKVDFEIGTLDDVMEAYRNHPMVEKVEPIGIHAMYATPNDGYFSYQWYHNQASDHDIDSPEAWDIQTGSDATVVAILDSGTRYYHPDLGGANASPSNPGASRGNIWINNAELNGSPGVDDDGNGYVDDWVGYDFIDGVSNCWTGEDCNTKDNDPRDFNGHGTHTAGIFAMITNDGYGMAGVAGGWNPGSQTEYGNGVKAMVLRMGYSYNYLGQEYGVVMMDAAAEAFYYAADNGARIASCSWGSSNSGGIGTAATYFINNGGIIVVAAGNDGAETSPDYLNGRGDCISVSATNENDDGASFTTYGTWVDICAPGDNIYSTYHDHTDPNTNYWASMGGTSMATPMVSGVCALIWSQNPGWTASQVENQLYSSADNIDAYLSSKYIGKMGAGRINAYNAVNTGPQPPVANFSGSPTSGCVPLTVNFTDLSTGDITSYDWDFGDGGSSTAENPSHQYTSGGTYTVSLTVAGPGGSDSETKTNYITVSVPPVAGFTGSPTSGEVPLTVNFTNQSSGAASYLWDFGDTQTSTAANPSHTYTSAGTYTVTLTATNACGSDDEVKVDYITVTCTPPAADFSGSPTSGEVPLTVNFTDLSTGATSWDWDFGDLGSSTQQNPQHTYTSPGTYTVALTVTNSCGSDTETKTNYITVTCTAPTANFSGSPTNGDAPLTVNFTDLSSGTAMTSWDWDFGDGGSSTAQNPSHEYPNEGTYTVSLTVTNPCGTDSEIKTDYITVTIPTIPYATLPYSTGFESGSFDQYWFTQSSNSNGAIEITTAYTPRGTYHMAMDAITNGTYVQNEAWLRLNLAGKSDVELSFWWKEHSDESHTQDGVFFSDNGGSSFVKVYDLIDGTSTYQEIVLDLDALAASNGLSLTGTFVVKFQQYDNYGLTTDGMTFDDINVTSLEVPPVADFEGSPISGTAPLTVSFTDLSTGNPTGWSWTFGDGGTSTQQNPTYEYTDPGTYTVSLTAYNAYGNDTETKTSYITVTEPSQEYALLPYSTGFESGSFDQHWFTQSSNSNGAIEITSAYTPRGSYHMAMDAITNGTYVQNESWLKLNLAGKGDVELSFWWKEFSDETHTQDGVFFSDNGGSSFVKVYDLINGTTTYQEIVLDLDALAASNGLSLTGTFVVKFQQYDNYGLTTDGMTFDDISVTSLEAPPVADFEASPTAGVAPLTVSFADLSTGNPTGWSWTFGDGGTSTQQNPTYDYTDPGTYTVSMTAYNAYGNDTETKTGYITVTEPGVGNWVVITYDDFEAGWGSYTDGGGDCGLYCGGTYAWQGSCAADIQDNSGVASSFYHTGSYNVTGYTELEIDFYFIAISMDNSNEDFWLQYYDGSSWLTVATWARSIDFDNGVFYHTTVTLTDAQFNFPTNARLRFMCDASGNVDDVYIDAITFSGWDPTARLRADNTVLPDKFSLSQNYPNPFNPFTGINYSLPVACDVELEVFNIMGQRVTTLVNDFKEAGSHTIIWDGTNEEGTQVASGVYFYRIKAGDFKDTKKMVLMK